MFILRKKKIEADLYLQQADNIFVLKPQPLYQLIGKKATH